MGDLDLWPTFQGQLKNTVLRSKYCRYSIGNQLGSFKRWPSPRPLTYFSRSNEKIWYKLTLTCRKSTMSFSISELDLIFDSQRSLTWQVHIKYPKGIVKPCWSDHNNKTTNTRIMWTSFLIPGQKIKWQNHRILWGAVSGGLAI